MPRRSSPSGLEREGEQAWIPYRETYKDHDEGSVASRSSSPLAANPPPACGAVGRCGEAAGCVRTCSLPRVGMRSEDGGGGGGEEGGDGGGGGGEDQVWCT